MIQNCVMPNVFDIFDYKNAFFILIVAKYVLIFLFSHTLKIDAFYIFFKYYVKGICKSYIF